MHQQHSSLIMNHKLLIPAVVLPFLFASCEKKEELARKIEASSNKIAEGVKEIADVTSESVKEAADEAKKTADEATEKLKAEAEAAAKRAAETVNDKIKEAVPKLPE
jgi:gas vesicle protein